MGQWSFKNIPILSLTHATLLCQRRMSLARFPERLDLLFHRRTLLAERLEATTPRKVPSFSALPRKREEGGEGGDKMPKLTLTKLTLSGWTVLMASVRPCRKDFVIAGSYVLSTRPGVAHW